MRFDLLAIVGLLGACGDAQSADSTDASMDAAGDRGQGSEAVGPLVVNEIMPKGSGPDWVELLNRSDAPVDLCNYFFTDNVDRLDHYAALSGTTSQDACTEDLLAPGERLLIFADDTQPPLRMADGVHAPFQLGIADEVHLVTKDGQVEDGLLFYFDPASVMANAGDSLSRVPDGEGLFYYAPTSQGEANPALPESSEVSP